MAALAWLLPASWQPGTARRLGRTIARLGGQGGEERRRWTELFGDAAGYESAAEAMQAQLLAEWLQLVRLHRPGATLPDVRLEGAIHVDAALAKGRGAVLWVVRSAFSHTVAKVALHQAGYRLHHLSRPDHGFSHSRFGMAVFNPIRTRIEQRFLAERLVIGDGKAGPVLARLAELLRENRVVSITAGGRASRADEVRCLGSTIRLPSRPVQLARETGAALLPVTVEALPDGTFVTKVHADLLTDATPDDRAVLQKLADIIGDYAKRAPDQFVRPLISAGI
jgi:lauroyl/myristoyl acyltransferase